MNNDTEQLWYVCGDDDTNHWDAYFQHEDAAHAYAKWASQTHRDPDVRYVATGEHALINFAVYPPGREPDGDIKEFTHNYVNGVGYTYNEH